MINLYHKLHMIVADTSHYTNPGNACNCVHVDKQIEISLIKFVYINKLILHLNYDMKIIMHVK